MTSCSRPLGSTRDCGLCSSAEKPGQDFQGVGNDPGRHFGEPTAPSPRHWAMITGALVSVDKASRSASTSMNTSPLPGLSRIRCFRPDSSGVSLAGKVP